MIKNFLFRPTSGNMLHHPFVENIRNEQHIVESLTKHLTGIIKKRQKKGRDNKVLYNSEKRGPYIYLLFLVSYLFKILVGGGWRGGSAGERF